MRNRRAVPCHFETAEWIRPKPTFASLGFNPKRGAAAMAAHNRSHDTAFGLKVVSAPPVRSKSCPTGPAHNPAWHQIMWSCGASRDEAAVMSGQWQNFHPAATTAGSIQTKPPSRGPRKTDARHNACLPANPCGLRCSPYPWPADAFRQPLFVHPKSQLVGGRRGKVCQPV